MVLEWVRTLGPILISWPVVGLITLFIFRKPLRALADRFTGEDIRRIKVGIFEIEAEIKQTKGQIERLYALSMSEDAFGQLKKLSTDSYGRFWLDPELRVGLAPELNYFKILGYIKFDRVPGVVDVRDLPRDVDDPKDDLSRYISFTSQGREFIDLREQALKNA